jgi:hypothetical protein
MKKDVFKKQKPTVMAGFAICSSRIFPSNNTLEGQATRLNPWIFATKISKYEIFPDG